MSRGLFLILILSLLLTSAERGSCELSKGLVVSGTYDSNIFGNSLRASDYISRIGFYVDGGGETVRSDFSYSYVGSFYNFSRYKELNFSHHRLGTAYRRNIGRAGDFLYAGFEISLRLDRPEYRYYDYSNLRAYLVSKYYLAENVMARGGYEFNLRNYTDASSHPYSYREHYLFLQLNGFFEAGITLRAELDVGYKGFVGGGSGDMASDVGQTVGVLRVAKSLGGNAGMFIQGLVRRNFRGGSGGVPIYTGFYDEGFEDQYSYSGEELKVAFTRMFPLNLKLRSSLTQVVRRYGGDYPLLGADGSSLGSYVSRTDRALEISASLSWDLELRFPISGIGLDLECSYLANGSNIPYYKWRGGAFSAGVSFGF